MLNRTTPTAVALYRSLRWLVVALLAWAALQTVRPAIRAGDGLSAHYFTNTGWAGRPAIETIDDRPSTAAMGRRWNSRIPQQFSARWIGYLAVPRSGVHTLSLTSDDGARLLVDGLVVVDNSGQHAALTASNALRLDRGPHAVVIEYVQTAASTSWNGRGPSRGAASRQCLPGLCRSDAAGIRPSSPRAPSTGGERRCGGEGAPPASGVW